MSTVIFSIKKVVPGYTGPVVRIRVRADGETDVQNFFHKPGSGFNTKRDGTGMKRGQWLARIGHAEKPENKEPDPRRRLKSFVVGMFDQHGSGIVARPRTGHKPQIGRHYRNFKDQWLEATMPDGSLLSFVGIEGAGWSDEPV